KHFFHIIIITIIIIFIIIIIFLLLLLCRLPPYRSSITAATEDDDDGVLRFSRFTKSSLSTFSDAQNPAAAAAVVLLLLLISSSSRSSNNTRPARPLWLSSTHTVRLFYYIFISFFSPFFFSAPRRRVYPCVHVCDSIRECVCVFVRARRLAHT
ncbi:Uncharacterized protein FWK35_00021628, partial [Aphis craccivora]